MESLDKIYKKAGLKKPNIYDNNKINEFSDSKFIEFKVSKEKFYLNFDIIKKLNLRYETNVEKSDYFEEYFSEKQLIEDEIIYSSKIEGINVEKKSFRKDSNDDYAIQFSKAFELLLTFDEIGHKELEQVKNILSSTDKLHFDGMTKNDQMYRDDSVAIYKKKNGLDQKIHDGVKHTDIKKYMTDLFDILNNEYNDQFKGSLNYIEVRTAITHFIFEYIHPYFDGNGRVGRMLIKWLVDKKTNYNKEFSFISEIILINKQKYYKALEDSQRTNDLSYFTSFMFALLNESFKTNNKLNNILLDKERNISNIQVNFIKRLLLSGMNDTEVTYPDIKGKFEDITRQAFNKMVNKLHDQGILTIAEGTKTNYISLNEKYINKEDN